MSEPRNKGISQGQARDFMAGGCRTVHAIDPGSLCVVGPRPYYKIWELSDQIVLPQKEQILYTFDFFVRPHTLRTLPHLTLPYAIPYASNPTSPDL